MRERAFSMSDQVAVKGFNIRKILALIALAVAATSAYNAVGYLVYGGITYYTICAIAILFNYRRANLMLWAAVGVHALLVGYSLWGWQTAQIIPCIYCFGAAGFALLAATVYTRLPVAILPALLIAGVWFAWPHLFYLDNQAGASGQPVVENQYQTENQTGVTVKPDPSGDNNVGAQPASAEKTGSAGEANTGSQVAKDGNNTVETTPAAVTTPAAGNTNPDTGQGGTQAPGQDPGAAGNTTPAVNPGGGDTTKPADPPKPPETTTPFPPKPTSP
jgi:hypothetical protein